MLWISLWVDASWTHRMESLMVAVDSAKSYSDRCYFRQSRVRSGPPHLSADNTNRSRSDRCKCPNVYHSLWCSRWRTCTHLRHPICEPRTANVEYFCHFELKREIKRTHYYYAFKLRLQKWENSYFSNASNERNALISIETKQGNYRKCACSTVNSNLIFSFLLLCRVLVVVVVVRLLQRITFSSSNETDSEYLSAVFICVNVCAKRSWMACRISHKKERFPSSAHRWTAIQFIYQSNEKNHSRSWFCILHTNCSASIVRRRRIEFGNLIFF